MNITHAIHRFRSWLSRRSAFFQRLGQPNEGKLMGDLTTVEPHDRLDGRDLAAPPPLEQRVRPESERMPGNR